MSDVENALLCFAGGICKEYLMISIMRETKDMGFTVKCKDKKI